MRVWALAIACAPWATLARADPPVDTAPAAPEAAPADEVRVQGRHREVGGATMRRDEAREVPGAFGDPSRFVEAMPGVVPTASGLQAFFVRGAPPETTGFFLDGVPVPALYHIGFGPSVVHPGLLDRAELFPGAAPAYFGRSIGAVIEGDTTDPTRRARGEGNVRILDASALLETPFAEGKGTALASGRYAYPGLIVPLFAPNVGLSYWDYQSRLSWSFSDRDRVSLFVFGSYDRLTEKDVNGAGIAYKRQLVDTEFHRADLRYDHAFGPRATLRVAATFGQDTSGDETSDVNATSARLRAELEARPSKDVRVRAGADVAWTRYALGSSPLDPADPFPVQYGQPATPREDVIAGARADVAWRISRRVEVVPGVRADLFTSRPSSGPSSTSTTTPAIDPRLATRVTIAPRVAVLSTFGMAHQVPGLVVVAPDATPLLRSPGVQHGVQASVQLSQGVEVALPEGFIATVTGFLHHYEGLPDLTAPCVVGSNECVAQRVDGRAFGLELLVRRSLTERLGVMIAYTLSSAQRQAHEQIGSAAVAWIPSEYDRTHVLSAIATYDLGNRWRAGARLYAYSGRPYTQAIDGPPFNTDRLPGFWRLDVRLEKAWPIGETGRVSFFVEGLNVTLNKEAVDATCQPSPAGPTCAPDYLGPIAIPSVGMEGAF